MYAEFYETVDGVHSCEVATPGGSVVALTIIDSNGRFETFIGAEKVGYDLTDLVSAKAQLFAIFSQRFGAPPVAPDNAAPAATATMNHNRRALGLPPADRPARSQPQHRQQHQPHKAQSAALARLSHTSTRPTGEGVATRTRSATRTVFAAAAILLLAAGLVGAGLYWGSERSPSASEIPDVLARERIELRVRDATGSAGTAPITSTAVGRDTPDREPRVPLAKDPVPKPPEKTAHIPPREATPLPPREATPLPARKSQTRPVTVRELLAD